MDLSLIEPEPRFFYNATIKQPSAVTKAIKAKFTCSIADQPGAMSSLDTNLITICSNVLKVYTLTNNSMDLRMSQSFNDKIIDVLAVPSGKFAHRQAKQDSLAQKGGSRKRIDVEQLMEDEENIIEEAKLTPEYLFVLTDSFHCALLAYNQTQHSLEVVSRGNVAEKSNGERREPPYSVFLGEGGAFVALMLYENVLKVIPLVAHDGGRHLMQLTNAINVRIRHSEVSQVVPVFSG